MRVSYTASTNRVNARLLIAAVGTGIGVGFFMAPRSVHADPIWLLYECDVAPYDAPAAWGIANACDRGCTESLGGGTFTFQWDANGDYAGYDFTVSRPPVQPPRSLWVEWRFRSNRALNQECFSHDGQFVVAFRKVLEVVFLHGDAALSFSGDDYATGLALDEFHTYRFESANGSRYTVSVDGHRFIDRAGVDNLDLSYIQFGGFGSCGFPGINTWDYVRFGTLSSGEIVESSDPASGFVDPRHGALPDRFAITFDQPSYVNIDNITVESIGGVKPIVTKTWRRDGDGPETLEVVLYGPIPVNASTRFIISNGSTSNLVWYTSRFGDADGDGTVDLMDVADLQNCFGHTTPDPVCGAFDLSDDGTVNVADLDEFMSELLTGPVH